MKSQHYYYNYYYYYHYHYYYYWKETNPRHHFGNRSKIQCCAQLNVSFLIADTWIQRTKLIISLRIHTNLLR